MSGQSTQGTLLKYAAEATKDVRPTTGYITVPDVTDLPAIGGAPGSIEVTNLSEVTIKQYVPDLADPGGAVEVQANLTNTFLTAWAALVTAYDTASASDLGIWFEYQYPAPLSKSLYFRAIPTPLTGSPAARSQALTISAYLTPDKLDGFDVHSTT